MGMVYRLGAAVVRHPKESLMDVLAWTNFTGSMLAMERSKTKKVSSRVTRSLKVVIHNGAPGGHSSFFSPWNFLLFKNGFTLFGSNVGM